MLCTLQFSLILAPHSFLVRFLPERSLSLLFTFPMAVEQALTQIGPFFYFIISPFYFSSFLLFQLSSGGRTSSDPNWPLTTLLPQRIVTNIGVWEDSDKHNHFIGKKQTSMKEDWNLENVEVEFNLQMLRLFFFYFQLPFC